MTDTEFAAWAVSKLFPSDSWTEDPMGGKIWLGEKRFNPCIDANDAEALAKAWCAVGDDRRIDAAYVERRWTVELGRLMGLGGYRKRTGCGDALAAAICAAVYAAEGGES